MFPLVHVLQRKWKEKKDNDPNKKRFNRSPHIEPPKVGLYGCHDGRRFTCSKCEVLSKVQGAKTTMRITMEFVVMHEHFDLYFPVSECGNVEKLTIKVDGKQAVGQVFRQMKDGRFVPSSNKEEFFATSSDEEDVRPSQRGKASAKKGKAKDSDSDDDYSTEEEELGEGVPLKRRKEAKKAAIESGGDPDGTKNRLRALRNAKNLTGKDRPPTVYSFVSEKVSESVEGASGYRKGKKAVMQVEVVTDNIRRESADQISVPFPFTAVAKSPDRFQYHIEMNTNIRRIVSPNKSHPIFPYIKGKTAEVSLDITRENPMRMTDYMYIIMVEVGEPIVAECADPVAILVLVTAIGMMIFYVLTKDLDEY